MKFAIGFSVFRYKYGNVDKATLIEFNNWVQNVKDHIGEQNLVTIPPTVVIPRMKARVTRKEMAIALGYRRPRIRYVSRYTDDSKLFEYVPQYLRRLEREKRDIAREQEKVRIDAKIKAELSSETEIRCAASGVTTKFNTSSSWPFKNLYGRGLPCIPNANGLIGRNRVEQRTSPLQFCHSVVVVEGVPHLASVRVPNSNRRIDRSRSGNVWKTSCRRIAEPNRLYRIGVASQRA